MKLWQVEIVEVLTMSQHNKRAHYMARLVFDKNNKERNIGKFSTYREAFVYYLKRSFAMNYCAESIRCEATV